MAIQSRIQPATSVPPVASALPVTLADGDVIEARVAAILPNGQVRLATSLGTTDVSTSVTLTPGATVKLLVQTVGAQLTLALMETTGTAGGSATTTSTSTATAAARAYGSTLPGAQQALSEILQTALPRQAGPAALFANLKPVVEIAGKSLPPAIAAAARDVLAHAIDADAPVSAAAVRQAVIGSGIFRETRLALGDAAAAEPAQDLKSALLALRGALATVAAAWPQTSGETQGTTPTAPSAGAPAVAESGEAPAGAPGAGAGSPAAAPKPGPAAGLQPAVVPGAGDVATGLPGSGLPPSVADALARLPTAAREAALQAIRSATDAGDPEMARVLARAGLAATAPSPAEAGEATADPARAEPLAADDPARRRQAASLPRIDLPPRAEEPATQSLRNGMSQGEAVRLLLDQTDATLDRVRLSQYGALHRDDPAQATPTAARDAPAWIFDVPIVQGRETASAQVRITRDGRGQAAEGGGRRWSVEFALDTTATGPIHAEIRLWGRHVGVTLWAERAETVHLLKDQAPVLHDALGQAELDVEDVAVLAGSPQPPEAERGYFVDTRS